MKPIYEKQILELYAEKPNFGKLEKKTHQVKFKNISCTDEIIIDLQIENNIIIDAKYHGKTCFVSTISASILLENIKGKTLDEIKKMNKKYIDELLGMKIIETRINCELLPLEALKTIK